MPSGTGIRTYTGYEPLFFGLLFFKNQNISLNKLDEKQHNEELRMDYSNFKGVTEQQQATARASPGDIVRKYYNSKADTGTRTIIGTSGSNILTSVPANSLGVQLVMDGSNNKNPLSMFTPHPAVLGAPSAVTQSVSNSVIRPQLVPTQFSNSNSSSSTVVQQPMSSSLKDKQIALMEAFMNEKMARKAANRKRNRESGRNNLVGGQTGANDVQLNSTAMQSQRIPAGGSIPSSTTLPTNSDEIGDAEDVEASHESDFTTYTPKFVTFGAPHPDELIESASLGTAELPPITYKLNLKDSPCVVTGAISSAQLESIIYACQISEKRMKPDSSGQANRLGFFLGDGAGVGKGRQLAGIINFIGDYSLLFTLYFLTCTGFVYENWLAGHKKHVWLSASADLCLDSRRDLDDIGAQEIRPIELRNLPYGPIKDKTGLLFCTYSSLISKSAKLKMSRLDQIVSWLGGVDFNGCLMFDECHKAKNIFQNEKNSSKTGLAVIEIQRMLPNARIIYCSATGISEPSNMAYMTRLDLWGAGKPFLKFQDFKIAIETSGIGMMELLALHLKRNGQYISRTLSFARCSFKVVENVVNRVKLEQYDAAALIWQDILKDLDRFYPNCLEGIASHRLLRASPMPLAYALSVRIGKLE